MLKGIFIKVSFLEMEGMDDGKFNDWVNNNIDTLRESFCENMEDEFEDYLQAQYINSFDDDSDAAYDRWKDDQIEDNEV